MNRKKIINLLLFVLWVIIQFYISKPEVFIFILIIPILGIIILAIKIFDIVARIKIVTAIKKKYNYRAEKVWLNLAIVFFGLSIIVFLTFDSFEQLLPMIYLASFYVTQLSIFIIETQLGFYNVSIHDDYISINKLNTRSFYFQSIDAIKEQTKTLFTFHDRFGNTLQKVNLKHIRSNQREECYRELKKLQFTVEQV